MGVASHQFPLIDPKDSRGAPASWLDLLLSVVRLWNPLRGRTTNDFNIKVHIHCSTAQIETHKNKKNGPLERLDIVYLLTIPRSVACFLEARA